MRNILVTGGYGFLGRAVARHFKLAGNTVYGIGNGRWDDQDARESGFDHWLNANVSVSSFITLECKFDIIVHCAGNGSVGYSLKNPLQDFRKTVEGSMELLEYIRVHNKSAHMIYPSSAGVYGAKPDQPIKETDPLEPISPYGYSKKVVEELCESYSKSYGLHVSIIRFFSIYGPGLTKQLLWDAANKLCAPDKEAVFWGTGEETRDWIYVEDAAVLIDIASKSEEPYAIFNGGSGVKTTVKDTVALLKNSLGSDSSITFNDVVKDGDPRYYHADMAKTEKLGFYGETILEDGIERFATWFKTLVATKEHIIA